LVVAGKIKNVLGEATLPAPEPGSSSTPRSPLSQQTFSYQRCHCTLISNPLETLWVVKNEWG
jgi:hypothetical protein